MAINSSNTVETNKEQEPIVSNFIYNIIEKDLKENRYGGKIYTRFPPEPNGYLHVGHAKAICINFGTALKYGGKCNLRFDDTNPVKEDIEYVEAIKEDVKWLGFQWDKLIFASDYFDTIYGCAIKLIEKGKAYVCDLTAEQLREYRGTLKNPGVESPYRNRSIEENLNLFERMKDGEFQDGEKVLRAKIDMASPNINLRDPALYRISHASHHNTGDKWCIYPMYDFAHPLEDAIEGITHSFCTLEFEDHRALYDWVIEEMEWENPPKQIEFARLNLTETMTSKRYLKALVDDGTVMGWDDPRMPTIAGLRRRGYTPEAIRDFCEKIGVSKANSTVERGFLEHCIREDLKEKTHSKMVVMEPLKITIKNYPEDLVEWVEIENGKGEEAGIRKVPFSRTLYVDRSDFMEEPVKGYFRLFPGNEVRFKGAYFIKCEEVIKDANGEVKELICTYDPQTKSGGSFSGRKVKGTIHWVEASHAVPITVNAYDTLMIENEDGELIPNPESLCTYQAFGEPSVAELAEEERCQFFRHGYYILDNKLSSEKEKVFTRIVDLKSSWKK